MESFKFGEVVLISFPFTNIKDQKKGPALVLIDTDDDVIVCRIASGKDKSNYGIPLLDW